MCAFAYICIALKFVLGETSVISHFALVELYKFIYAGAHSRNFWSVPKTVNMMAFGFGSTSPFLIFVGAKTYFWQRKNIIGFLYSSLFPTSISLAFHSAWMKRAIHFQLFKCICNTFGKQLTFELLTEYMTLIARSPRKARPVIQLWTCH